VQLRRLQVELGCGPVQRAIVIDMAAVSTLELTPAPDEQRMLLHGVSWKEYVILRELMDRPGLRMTYLEGELELMSPSPEHELWKTNIARLIELYAFLTGVELYGYGSTTFKKEAKERGAEPDECYLVGKKLEDFPQIVLEVLQTSPLLNKLDVYFGMGVPEVWVFKDGAFRLYALDRASNRYVQAERSALIPGLDFALVARFALREDTPQALREFEQALRR
jgi:Uma2 family endonuclease